MLFIKYPTIENHYREKYIARWTARYPQLVDERFIIQEKLHGANFQIIFTEDGIQFARRNGLLEEGESFYGYQEVMEGLMGFLNQFKAYADVVRFICNVPEIRLYGELFGGGIQSGVDYGDHKQFRVFDIRMGDIILPQQELFELFQSYGWEKHLVPVICTVKGLVDALNVNSEVDSKILSIPDNMCEGVVIKPLYACPVDDNGSPFAVKKVNPNFREGQSIQRKPTPFSAEAQVVINIFNSHLNENRVQSVFSKEGVIQSKKDIGRYLSLILEDAKVDFLKDHEEMFSELTSEDKAVVFTKGAHLVVPVLLDYLEG